MMNGKLCVALLFAASPAFAQEAPPAEPAGNVATEAASQPVAYKTKKVCRPVEVVGSAIPRQACSTKRIPLKASEKKPSR